MASDKKMYFLWIGASVVLIAVALVMLLKQTMFIEILVGTLSICVLMSSLVSVFTIRRYQEIPLAFGGTIVKGVSGIIIAVLALVLLITGSKSSAQLMLKILAGQVTLASLILLIEVFTLKKGMYKRKPLLLEALVSAIVAVLVFILPAETASLIITLIAAVAITVGIAGIVISVLMMRSGKKKEVKEESTLSAE